MKKAIFDWLCSLIITGNIYLLIILPFVGLLIFFLILFYGKGNIDE